MTRPIVLAVPKGRILAEALPLLARAGIVPEAAFGDTGDRSLRFATGDPDLSLIRVRAFDVATFVAHGAAQIGVVGSDVVEEFGFSELYAPVDLGIGRCRLSVARQADAAAPAERPTHLRVATKYPRLTGAHFAARGVRAECVKLNGAMELAPSLGLADHIVDLVSTGDTLRANGLVEVATVLEVSARLIVNRAAFKTDARVTALVARFRSLMERRELAA